MASPCGCSSPWSPLPARRELRLCPIRLQRRLSRLALQEEKRGEWEVASKLWELTVRPHTEAGSMDRAEAAFTSMIRCMENADASPLELISIHLKHYAWRRRLGFHIVAIESLDAREIIAAKHRLIVEQAKIIDEKGGCYQWVQKSKDALPLHKKAVRLARMHDLPTQLRFSLNNLGEAFRHLGKTNEAVTAFEESEMLSRAAGDFPGSVATAVNRCSPLKKATTSRTRSQCCRSAEAKRGNGSSGASTPEFWSRSATWPGGRAA